MNNIKDIPLEIFSQLQSVRKIPNPYTFCPKCGKPFVKKPLNYLKIVVPSCPDHHGFWIDEINALKIVNFFQSGKICRPQETQRIAGLAVWLLIVASFVVMMLLERQDKRREANYKLTYSMEHIQNVGSNYWPARDFSHWNAFPSQQSAILDVEELEYFYTWMDVINEGIVNRLNMNDALLSRRPAQEYVEIVAYFSDKQNDVIRRLRQMYPPDRLQKFHHLVIQAASDQIDFYDDFARQKFTNPSLNLKDLLEHPKLKSCDQQLWAAYYEFQRIYPNRDTATNNAIEQRLCWMDLI
ncbi:MAG: hypothetical protein JNN05_06365 [Candidatus Omnitrophica bacterium]|nr:hypothetical protein [Candidatus Omnitrophota bacterium]